MISLIFDSIVVGACCYLTVKSINGWLTKTPPEAVIGPRWTYAFLIMFFIGTALGSLANIF